MLEVKIKKSGTKSDGTHWTIVQWEIEGGFLIEGILTSKNALGKENTKVTVPKSAIRQMK